MFNQSEGESSFQKHDSFFGISVNLSDLGEKAETKRIVK